MKKGGMMACGHVGGLSGSLFPSPRTLA
ncbi:MAG: hypothetical protein U1U88_001896 [Lawsonella clevelandensis]